MQALHIATANAAEFLGISDRLGTIEPGKMADMVLLSGNPLEDITNTRKIDAVILGGNLLDGSVLQRMLRESEVVPAKEQ